MRRFLLTAVMCVASISGSRAADLSDLPILRGPVGLSSSHTNWAGVYFGGQVVRGVADMDFTNSAQDLLAKLLNNVDLEQQFNISQWPLLGKSHASGTGYGGFAGYNIQWTDAVLGIEMNYTHGNLFGSNSGSQARSFFFPTDYFSEAAAASSASMKITDYGSLRVRAGWAFGSVLPYAFGGVALGQADINRTASVLTQYTYVGSAIPPKPNIGPNFEHPFRQRERPFHLWLGGRHRHGLDDLSVPFPACRMGISPLRIDGRHHRQHAPRRRRLQVLT